MTMESILYNIKEQVTEKDSTIPPAGAARGGESFGIFSQNSGKKNEDYHQFMGKVQYEERQESPTINL